MRVQRCQPPERSDHPLLIFIHGSLHGSWCWEEHWMPRLAHEGIETAALNLRGTSGAPVPADYNGGRQVVSLADHVEDILAVTEALAEESGGRGVAIVGHSFGGLMLMKMMEKRAAQNLAGKESGIRGVGFLCAVPPVGNSPMVSRLLFQKPRLAWKITWGLAAKAVLRDVGLCRDVFMDAAMPDETVERYMKKLEADGQYSLDLKEVDANLPVAAAAKGKAAWLPLFQRAGSVLVIGASEDAIVDQPGLDATGEFLSVPPQVLDGVAHDLMLDSRKWEDGAKLVKDWVEAL